MLPTGKFTEFKRETDKQTVERFPELTAAALAKTTEEREKHLQSYFERFGPKPQTWANLPCATEDITLEEFISLQKELFPHEPDSAR